MTITPNGATLETGQQVQLTSSAGGGTKWSSSNSAVAPVSNGGIVKALAVGSATITAKKGSQSAQTMITVVAPTTPTPVPPDPTPIPPDPTPIPPNPIPNPGNDTWILPVGDIAASMSQADIEALVSRMTPGTEGAPHVYGLPSGTCHVDSRLLNLTLPPYTVLLGPGQLSYGDQQLAAFVDDLAGGDKYLNITTPADGRARLANVKFLGGTGSGHDHMVGLGGACRRTRLDHCFLSKDTYVTRTNIKPMVIAGPLRGVMDSSVIDFADQIGFLQFVNSQGSPGDPEWAAPTGFGTDDFFFIEDCQVRARPMQRPGNIPIYLGSLTDSHSAGKFVVRFVRSTAVSLGQTHPTGHGAGQDRGCRAHEVYCCEVTSPINTAAEEPNYTIGWVSSGPALYWGISAVNVAKSFLQLMNMRVNNGTYSQVPPPNGYGYCGKEFDGLGSAWDGNTDPLTGYPGLDQPGRGRSDLLSGDFPVRINTKTSTISWPNQALEPVREWLNTFSAVPGWGASDLTNTVGVNDARRLAENRDYYKQVSPFDGTKGMGVGTLAQRPANPTVGVGYWVTDEGSWNDGSNALYTGQGRLYVCTAPGVWSLEYEPHKYPHDLRLL